jgi:hypothetical protein
MTTIESIRQRLSVIQSLACEMAEIFGAEHDFRPRWLDGVLADVTVTADRIERLAVRLASAGPSVRQQARPIVAPVPTVGPGNDPRERMWHQHLATAQGGFDH